MSDTDDRTGLLPVWESPGENFAALEGKSARRARRRAERKERQAEAKEKRARQKLHRRGAR